MVNPRSRRIRRLIPFGILVLGLLASWQVSQFNHRISQQKWSFLADRVAQWMSQSLYKELETSISSLLALQTLLTNSTDVTSEEFRSAFAMQKSSQHPFYITGASYFSRTNGGQWQLRERVIPGEPGGWERDIAREGWLVDGLNQASRRTGGIWLAAHAPPEGRQGEVAMYAIAVEGARAVVCLLDTAALVGDLLALETSPRHMKLQAFARAADGERVPIWSNSEGEPVLVIEKSLSVEGLDIALSWEVGSGFIGGPAARVGQLLWYGGVILSLFLAALSWLGLKRNAVIVGRVNEATRSLELALARQELILHSTDEGIFGIDTRGNITFSNQAASALLGFPASNLVGSSIHDVLHEPGHMGEASHSAQDCPIIAISRTGGRLVGKDEMFYREDGSSFPVEYVVVSMDRGGEVIGSVLTFRNVEERKKSQEKLQASETKFRTLVESMPDPLIIVDDRGVIRMVNFASSELFGYESEQLIGQAIEKLVPERLKAAHVGHRDDYTSGASRIGMQGSERELLAVSRSGREFEVEVTLNPINTSEGKLVAASLRDVSERHRLTAQMALEREQFKKILDLSPDAIVIVVNRVVRFANPVFSKMFHAVPGETLQSDRLHESVRDQFERLLDNPTTLRKMETTVLDINGRSIHILLSIEPFVFEGEPAALGWCIDVSQMKEAQSQLEAARQLAEESAEAKSRFLANMSHEIRTPMNAIIGMSHLVLQSHLQEKQRNYVEKVHTSAKILLGIINDIMDFSKIEAGKLTLEETTFFLEQVMGNLGNLLGLKADEKGLELLFEIDDSVPEVLEGDPLRLGQILINLGSNAVKFTSSGEVRIRVIALEEDDVSVTLQFDIADTGIGMTEAELSTVFETYVQADDSTTRRYGGSGLGLPISLNLAQLMNGKLWAESEPGAGSVFHFTARFGRVGARDDREKPNPKDLEGTRVLIVDDNASARQILLEYCVTLGLRPECVASGHEAIRLLRGTPDDPYELLIIDWKMPDLDGIETARRIQNDDALVQIPTIIMVTAYGREEAKQAAKGVRISTFLNKPVTASSLFDGLTEARSECKATAPLAGDTQDELFNAHVEHLRGATILLVEDHLINRELAVDLLRSNGMVVEVAENGFEALESLEHGHFDGVLMDCQMPGMDGYEATRRLREDPRFKTLPVLAMTANAMVGDREKVLAVGMNDHIAKPIDIEKMFAIMAKWITPANPVSSASERLAPISDEEAPAWRIDGVDVRAGLSRVQQNPELYRRLLRRFLEGYAGFMDEFDRAVASEHWETAQRLAHTLKGLAGTVGAMMLSNRCRALEIETGARHVADATRDAVAEELARVLASVDSALGQLPESAEAQAGLPEAADDHTGYQQGSPAALLQAPETLRAFREAVAGFDPAARERFQSLRSLLLGAGLVSEAEALGRALDGYDFEEALMVLNQVQTHLQSAEGRDDDIQDANRTDRGR